MPRQDWCAMCVADRIRKHGKFDGSKGLLPAVTQVKGTRLCGPHGEEVLQNVFTQADIQAHEWTIADSPALSSEYEEASLRG